MKILFIRFSSFGDALLTTGVMKQLHELLPEAQIDVLTFNEFAPVWEGLGFVSQIHTVRKGVPLKEYIKAVKSIPAYDYIFDLHSNLRSFIAGKLIKGKTYKYNKEGLARRLYIKFRICKSRLGKHVVQRYAEAVFPALGFAVPELESLRPWLPNNAVTDIRKIVLHPFASKFTKTWQHFDELARELAQAGFDVIVAGKGEFPKIPGVEQVDTPKLADLFSLMLDARLVVTTDSGPLHAACALNIPLIGIFGSTSRELGFYPVFRNCVVAERNDVPCRPCHPHGLPACPQKHFNCMRLINTTDIMKIIYTMTGGPVKG